MGLYSCCYSYQYFASVNGAFVSLVKERVLQAASLQWHWANESRSAFCQDTLKWCLCQQLRQRMPGVGVSFSLPSTSEEIQNRNLSHQDCLLHENFGWWLSPSEPWTLNPVRVHGCCSNRHSGVKGTVEYKMPESVLSLDSSICGSPVGYFFPKWNCQSYGLSALPAWWKRSRHPCQTLDLRNLATSKSQRD